MPYHFCRWREALETAADEKSVRAVIREYLGTLSPETLAALSEHNRRALVVQPVDIQGTAVTLLQEELRYEGDPEVAAVLHEMAHTFAAASVRLSRLRDPLAPATE